LQLLDQTWKDHLLSLDHLRQGINLRAYAQRDPLNEYKREAFALFEEMLVALRDQVTSVLSHVEFRLDPPDRLDPPPPPEPVLFGGPPPAPMPFGIAAQPEPLPFGGLSFSETVPMEREEALADVVVQMPTGGNGRAARRRGGNGQAMPNGVERDRIGERAAIPRAPWAGTPRNAACPCGSGRKFKHCHGRI
jgi:preprotein translocase subunit SecA